MILLYVNLSPQAGMLQVLGRGGQPASQARVNVQANSVVGLGKAVVTGLAVAPARVVKNQFVGRLTHQDQNF